jgi:hypothetical protein
MDGKLVKIAQFDNYIEADLAKQTLEDFGIKAVVTGDNSSNTYAGITAIEGPVLHVFENKAEEAKQILEEAKQPPLEEQ